MLKKAFMPRRRHFDDPTPQERAFALARVRGRCSWAQAFEIAYPAKNGAPRSRHGVEVEASKVAHRRVVQHEIDRLERQLEDEIAVADPRVRLTEARMVLRRIQNGRLDPVHGPAAVAALRDAERQLREQAREERRLLGVLIGQFRPRLPATRLAEPAPSVEAEVMPSTAPPTSPATTVVPAPSPAAETSPPAPPPDEALAAHVRERQAAVHALPGPALGTTTPGYRGFGSGGALPADGLGE